MKQRYLILFSLSGFILSIDQLLKQQELGTYLKKQVDAREEIEEEMFNFNSLPSEIFTG